MSEKRKKKCIKQRVGQVEKVGFEVQLYRLSSAQTVVLQRGGVAWLTAERKGAMEKKKKL